MAYSGPTLADNDNVISTSSPLSCTLPGGTPSDDQFILMVASGDIINDGPVTFGPDSGFTEQVALQEVYSSGNGVNLQAWSRTASSESDAVYECTHDLSHRSALGVFVFDDVDTSDPFVSKTVFSGTSSEPSFTTETPSEDNVYILDVVCWDQSKTLNSAPSDLTAIFHSDASGHDQWAGNETMESAAATGTDSWNISSSTRWVGVRFILRKASGATTIDAEGGSYTVSGQDASLEFSRVIDSEVGSYIIAGQDASVEFHALVSGEAGSYTVAGSDADLELHYLVDAESGSYGVSGDEANLEHHAVITSEAGSYGVTGSDATLDLALLISAESASYVVSGTDASLLATTILSAESGAYTINGQDAILNYSELTTGLLRRRRQDERRRVIWLST